MLWQQWSPNWHFDEATFERTAASFDNPDFVDVVIHAYRHDFSLAAGDPACEELEERLTHRPKITVSAVTLDGASDTLKPGGTADQADMFTARHEHHVIDAGHNLPQEAPAAFADAVACESMEVVGAGPGVSGYALDILITTVERTWATTPTMNNCGSASRDWRARRRSACRRVPGSMASILRPGRPSGIRLEDE